MRESPVEPENWILRFTKLSLVGQAPASRPGIQTVPDQPNLARGMKPKAVMLVRGPLLVPGPISLPCSSLTCNIPAYRKICQSSKRTVEEWLT